MRIGRGGFFPLGPGPQVRKAVCLSLVFLPAKQLRPQGTEGLGFSLVWRGGR